ncbi:MAG: hypothetical protein JJE47_16215 [Acidimicrobiia bacterium]|nr:hypothetical protein [Acidimicrobiia bacterium]
MTLHDRLQSAAEDTHRRMSELRPPSLPTRRPWVAVAVVITATAAVAIGLGNLGGGIAPTDTIAPPPSVEIHTPVTGYPVASQIPPGLELVMSSGFPGRDSHAYYLPSDGELLTGTQPFLLSSTISLPYGDPLTIEALLAAYESAGLNGITATTIRGKPAVMATDADGRISLVVLEDDWTSTELFAGGVGLVDVMAYAESIRFVSQQDYDASRLDRIRWDIRASGLSSANPETTRELLAGVPGVASVRLVWDPDLVPRVSLVLRNPDVSSVTTLGGSSVETGSEQAPRISFIALIMLEPEADPQTVADLLMAQNITPSVEFSPRISGQFREDFDLALASATVLQADPLMVQAPSSPVPSFDTSLLGTEVALSPATPGDSVPTPDDEGLRPSSVTDTDRSFVHLGSLDDGTRLYLQLFGPDALYWTTVSESGGATGGDDGSFSYSHYGIIGAFEGPDSGPFVTVKVPIETAVVVLTRSGESLWQRPVVGYGLFPLTGSIGTVEIRALDSSGQELGRWNDDL